LESEAAKLLHCWLCSNIRLGRSLGNGNGAHIDTLAPHVWGKAAWEEASTKVRSVRRGQLRDALDEISDRTRGLQGGMGWAIDQTSSGLVLVSRPKELPFLEGEHDMRPSEYHDLMSQPPMQEPDLFDPQDWTPD
ncbi:replication protein C, IncQ-type, partial [Aeromonas caviae]